MRGYVLGSQNLIAVRCTYVLTNLRFSEVTASKVGEVLARAAVVLVSSWVRPGLSRVSR